MFLWPLDMSRLFFKKYRCGDGLEESQPKARPVQVLQVRDPSAFKDETGVPPVSSFCHALGMLAKYLLVREVKKFE